MDPTAEYRLRGPGEAATRYRDEACSRGRSATGTRVRCDAGFTVLAVVVAVAVINILLGVAVVRWSFTMKRHREAELIWRGEQYAQALACYTQQQGVPPTRLEQLVEERCIRRLYEDPMSDSGEWRILRVADLLEEEGEGSGEPVGHRPALRPTGNTVSRSGLGLRARLEAEFSLDPQRSPAEMAGDRSSLPDRTSLAERVGADRRVEEVGPRDPEGGTPGRDEMNGIVGVVSTSDEESIRPRDGGRRYSDWEFMAGATESKVPMLPGLSAAPGEASPEQRQEGADRSERDRESGLRARVRRSSAGRGGRR